MLCDDLKVKDSSTHIQRLPHSEKTFFCENIGEADCDMHNGRIDPVLKLYLGCELMFMQNHDMKNNKANGSRESVSEAW